MINETSRDALKKHCEKLETLGDKIVRHLSENGGRMLTDPRFPATLASRKAPCPAA